MLPEFSLLPIEGYKEYRVKHPDCIYEEYHELPDTYGILVRISGATLAWDDTVCEAVALYLSDEEAVLRRLAGYELFPIGELEEVLNRYQFDPDYLHPFEVPLTRY